MAVKEKYMWLLTNPDSETKKLIAKTVDQHFEEQNLAN